MEEKAGDRCLKVAALSWPPLITFLSTTAPYEFTGIMLEIMDIIAGHLGFCFYIEVPAGMEWGRQLENKTFTGMLGEFQRQEWDMTITPMGVSYMRYQVMDFSRPMFMDETVVVYRRPTPEADVTGFIKPYTPLMWILIFVSAFVATGVILLVQLNLHNHKFYHKTDSRLNQEYNGGWRGTGKHMLHRAILWVSCCLLAQSAVWEPRRTSVRFVAGLWLLTSFIVTTVYRSNLKAMLILPRTPLPFNTIGELATTDISAYVMKGSLIDHAIKAAEPNSTLGRVADQIVVSNDLPSGMLGLYKGQHAAFGALLGLGPLAAGDFALNGYCSLYMINEGFLGTSVSLAFPKGSKLIPKVNTVISSLSESGILQHMYSAAHGNASNCMETITTSTITDVKLRPLELQDFFGVVLLYTGGMLLALVTFLMEIVVFSTSRRHRI